MNNLTTRKIVLGLLMTLVLAFSVQGIADALSLNEESELYQSKRLGSSFEMTFSVGLTGDAKANNQQGKRVSDHDNNDGTLVTGEPFRIDSEWVQSFRCH